MVCTLQYMEPCGCRVFVDDLVQKVEVSHPIAGPRYKKDRCWDVAQMVGSGYGWLAVGMEGEGKSNYADKVTNNPVSHGQGRHSTAHGVATCE